MRHKLDRYDSPKWYITAIAPYLNLSGVIGEPCVGGGVLASTILEEFSDVEIWTNDISTEVEANYHLDATKIESWANFLETDWVVTNPPYNSCFPIIRNAFKFAKKGMVLFLRTTWDEPCSNRGAWLFKHPYSRKITLPRFKYRKTSEGNWSTDTCTISAYIWEFEDDSKQTKLGRSLSIPKEYIKGYYDRPYVE